MKLTLVQQILILLTLINFLGVSILISVTFHKISLIHTCIKDISNVLATLSSYEVYIAETVKDIVSKLNININE